MIGNWRGRSRALARFSLRRTYLNGKESCPTNSSDYFSIRTAGTTSTGNRLAGRVAIAMLLSACIVAGLVTSAMAHPLGNFTINQYARLAVGADRIDLRYVIDMAEISTLQELQKLGASGDEKPTASELDRYLEHIAGDYASGLVLSVDDTRVPLDVTAKTIALPPGSGGLPTLRIEMNLVGAVPASTGEPVRRLSFEDRNRRERIGWREIVVGSVNGTTVFDSSAYGNGLTDELKAYPQDMLAAPLREEVASLSFTRGAAPAGATLLRTRDGHPVKQALDPLAELMNVPEVTPSIALLGLLVAAGFGALHAFSPGHGKTIVGAYLVGARASMKHAAFLGATVTITHTLSVFALGLVTLFASRYILPEQLFPVLSFISGAIVLVMGFSLFTSRLRGVLGPTLDGHDRRHEPSHHGSTAHMHSHGGGEHSHLPPGSDGSTFRWRNLLVLGVSGGLLPCPSALVVLLSALALHRVGYGMLLVVAFSFGLAATLTGIGLAFIYAGRWMKRPTGPVAQRIVRVLPMASAIVIAFIGAGICYGALVQAGLDLPRMLSEFYVQSSASLSGKEPKIASAGVLAVLGLGLVFGLKHATEVDHVVAVSTIVSEHRNLWRAALVGGLWGVGHTASLVSVGVVVLALRIAVPERIANVLEFGVALMILALGASALARALRRPAVVHVHQHHHTSVAHAHLHFHELAAEPREGPHAHAVARIGFKPLLVGAMHGLAGSAALTLLVLTQIDSALIGFAYLVVFGVGSIAGMLLMSGLVGLPFALSARKLTGMHHGLQATVGVLSIGFGCWYAYETGFANGLLSSLL